MPDSEPVRALEGPSAPSQSPLLLGTTGGVFALILGVWLLGYGYTPVDPAIDLAATSSRPAQPTGQGRGRPYVVIDRANNRLFLMRADSILLESIVSTGSGTVLREATGARRTWTFETPLGHHKILEERKSPVWTKPDWAFLEEGQSIPERLSDRIERGVLGEYALYLGDGYMIHGTLYERLLGHSVTHGCVRVGRDDLRTLVARVGPGTSVYVF